MKATFTAFASAVLAAFAAHASPMATEAWVRTYVSTNATGGSVRQTASTTVVSATMNIDGEDVTATMTISTSKEPAWVVSESTVTGMPVGVHFAVDGYGNACNYTNAACNVLYQSISQNWQRVTRTISGSVTNFVTNAVSVTRLDFRVNGVDYMGFEDPTRGTVSAAGLTNATGIVTFRRGWVTPSVRTLLTTPPAQAARPSLLSLFVGSAYAEWVMSDDDWALRTDISPNPIETTLDDGTVVKTYYYFNHYKWDGNGGIVEVPSVTIKGVECAVGYTKVVVAAGTDRCAVDASSADPAKIKDEICEAGLAAIEDPKLRVLFERFLAAGKFDDLIQDAVSAATDGITGGDSACPVYKNETTSTPPGTDDEKVLPPTPTVCGHLNIQCRSTQNECRFRCISCGTWFEDAHHFDNSASHCAVCTNDKTDGMGRKVKCGFASNDPEDHFFTPKQGGTDFACYCIHHGVWDGHPGFCNVTGWQHDELIHYREHECTRCGKVLKFDSGDHKLVPSSPIYIDESTCVVSNICSTCGYSEFGETVGHVFSAEFHLKLDNSVHTNFSWCSKCKSMVGNGTSLHVSDGSKEYGMGYEDGHLVTLHCVSKTGCGSDYRGGLESHNPGKPDGNYATCETNNRLHHVCRACTNCNYSVKSELEECTASPYGPRKLYTEEDWDKYDYYKCCKCDEGIGQIVPHNKHSDNTGHWCDNVTGKKHLFGGHVFVNNICSVCGYPRGDGTGDEYEYEVRFIPADCKQKCCYIGSKSYSRLCATNGVEIAEKDRGEWTSYDESGGVGYNVRCHYNKNGSCDCPYCRGEENTLYDGCYCPHVHNDLVCITDSFITGSYYLRFAGSTKKLIDFSDPVLCIADECFREAFVSMPNLIMANMNTVTNVGERTFECAFTNSGKLAEVDLRGLVTAGANAFEDAFVGCSMSYGIHLDSLRACGSGCFSGAFRNTHIGSLSFPSLVDCGSTMDDLFLGAPCASMTSLSAPKLAIEIDTGSMFDFSTMPNLMTLNLSGCSTNVYNRIGDMSGLSKLTRVDLHAMAGIPSFHAPTNAPNCMIVVPDELWAAWIVAPGWSNIADRIVPYSNQVIRTKVTVSFDTDMGEPLSPVAVYKGFGITAPTNTYKFASSYYGRNDGAFTLAGWYWDAAKTIPYVDGTAIASNVTLYAKWTDNRSISVTGAAIYGTTNYYYTGATYALGQIFESVEKWTVATSADGTHVSTNALNGVGGLNDCSFELSSGDKARIFVKGADGRIIQSSEVTFR